MATKHEIMIVRGALHQAHLNRKFDMFRNKRPSPPQWLLDKIADEKLTQGYERTRTERSEQNGRVTKKRISNQCTECFQLRSVNGTCGCQG